jgi:hypothetical protein
MVHWDSSITILVLVSRTLELRFAGARGDNTLKIFKNLFLQNQLANSIKLGTNYPWSKAIQVCANEGSYPLQRGDNDKNVKMVWCHLKIFSRSTGPILARLGTNHPWGRGFNFVQVKGIVPFQGEIHVIAEE